MARVLGVKLKPVILVDVLNNLFGPLQVETLPEFNLKEVKPDKNKKEALLRIFGRQFKNLVPFQIKQEIFMDITTTTVKQELRIKSEGEEDIAKGIERNIPRMQIKVSIPLSILPPHLYDSNKRIDSNRIWLDTPKQEIRTKINKRKLFESSMDLFSSPDEAKERLQDTDRLLHQENLSEPEEKRVQISNESTESEEETMLVQKQTRDQHALEDDLQLSESDEGGFNVDKKISEENEALDINNSSIKKTWAKEKMQSMERVLEDEPWIENMLAESEQVFKNEVEQNPVSTYHYENFWQGSPTWASDSDKENEIINVVSVGRLELPKEEEEEEEEQVEEYYPAPSWWAVKWVELMNKYIEENPTAWTETSEQELDQSDAISVKQQASPNSLSREQQLSETESEADQENGQPQTTREEEHVDSISNQEDNEMWTEEWLQNMDKLLEEELQSVKDLPEEYIKRQKQIVTSPALNDESTEGDGISPTPMDLDLNDNEDLLENYEPKGF